MTEQELNNLVQSLVKNKILKETGEGTLELAHDSLATAIASKRSDEELQIIEVKKMVASAVKAKQNANAYIDAKQMAYMEPYLTKIDLDEDAEKLIRKSKNRNRNYQFAVVAFMIFLVGLSLVSLYLWRDADYQKQLAIDNQNKADSNAILADNKANEANENAIEAKKESKRADSNAVLAEAKAIEAEKKTIEAEKQKANAESNYSKAIEAENLRLKSKREQEAKERFKELERQVNALTNLTDKRDLAIGIQRLKTAQNNDIFDKEQKQKISQMLDNLESELQRQDTLSTSLP